MAKTMTIREKKERVEQELKRLNAFEMVIEKLEGTMNWTYCDIKCDDDGNAIITDEGKHVFIAPSKDDWRREGYEAYASVLEEIKAIV